MQDLSYNPNDPVFSSHGLNFSVQIFTFENVYGLDPARCEETATTDAYTLASSGLRWAAGQEAAPGHVDLRLERQADSSKIGITARAAKTIRCVKLVLHGLPLGTIVNMREGDLEVTEHGRELHYPEGWRSLYTPLVIVRTPGQPYLYLRSLDTQVRMKRFVFFRRGETMDAELIYEPLATEMETSITVPLWEVGSCTEPETIMAEQAALIERAYGLLPWEERPDVPAWAKEISLVVALHCQHWSGYIFNDYAKILRTMQWFAQHIDPRRVLVYLPGWEGRYYWQYGDYRPDPRMGGEEGFRKLIAGAKELGMPVMPMFGINIVNDTVENYERWGAPAVYTSAGGYRASGSVDWDGSRHYDHGWGRLLNPGAPTWQKRLVEQIRSLVEQYGFEGVFLDISAAWWNDPNHPVFPGTRELIERIREGYPDLFIAGEGWYDGVGVATPLMQSGHTEGVLHWHDQPYEEFFSKYNRQFAHLCLGDPGRGSTGSHELGFNPIQRAPVRKGSIPTVTLVEDSLEVAQEQILAIIADAKEYAEKYIASARVEVTH